MRGPSRAAFRAAREKLAETVRDSQAAAAVSQELFWITGLLDGEPGRHASVDKVIPDLDGHSTHDLGIDDHVEVDAPVVHGRQRRRKAPSLLPGELGGDPHQRDHAPPPVRGQDRVMAQVPIQVTSPWLHRRLRDQPLGGR